MSGPNPYALAAAGYLALKATYSLTNDAAAAVIHGHYRAPLLRRFSHPREIWDYFVSCGAPYRPEPGGGAADHYTSPPRVQWALENRQASGALDCDDLALWAAATWRACGGVASLVTILDAGFVGNHTMCIGTTPTGRRFIIDTNGYHEDGIDTDEAIMQRWTAIYGSLGYRYIAVVHHGGPWL